MYFFAYFIVIGYNFFFVKKYIKIEVIWSKGFSCLLFLEIFLGGSILICWNEIVIDNNFVVDKFV